MFNLYIASAFSNLLVLIVIACWLVGIMEYGTFMGMVYSLPLLIWASWIKFKVAHTVIVR